MKRIFIIVSFFIFSQFLYSQDIQTEQYQGYIMPSEKFKIQEHRGKTFESVDINGDDIELAESILYQYMEKYNHSIFSKLSLYRRQYLGLFSQGRRIVYINLFMPTKSDYESHMKTTWIMVRDGGDDFFSLYIDIDTGFCFNLLINGES